MEASAEGLLDKIKPPRLEDAGLEDCALAPELIKEAFAKAATSFRSIITASDEEDEGEDRCVDDPWSKVGDSHDELVGIKEGMRSPSGGCAAEKGLGKMEDGHDTVAVGGGAAEDRRDDLVGLNVPESGEAACVDGLQGLEIKRNGEGKLGNRVDDDDADKNEDEESEKPILAEGYV